MMKRITPSISARPVQIDRYANRKQSQSGNRLHRPFQQSVDHDRKRPGHEQRRYDWIAPYAIRTINGWARPPKHEQRNAAEETEQYRRKHHVREELLVRAAERENGGPDG